MYNIHSKLMLITLIIPVLLWLNVSMPDCQNNTWTEQDYSKENLLIYMKSHSKSRSFFSSMETCVLTAEDFFWTITPFFLETTLPLLAFVPLSGFIPMKRLKSK